MDLEVCPSNSGFSDTEQVILHRCLGLEPSSHPCHHIPPGQSCALSHLCDLSGG